MTTGMRIWIVIAFLVVLGVSLTVGWHTHSRDSLKSYNKKAFKHQFVIVQANHLLGFNLVDPEQAPHNIRDSVMRGYRLMRNTAYYAPDHANNQLACTNCHFCSGDTLGGRMGGSLWLG